MNPLLVPRLLFACAMIVLFAIDLEHHLLPDRITLPGIVVGLVFSLVLPPGPLSSADRYPGRRRIALADRRGLLPLLRRGGMGGGDVKMLAMIGAFLGWKLMLVTLILSSIAGSVTGLVVIVARKGDMKYALPYGTFLALAALCASLYGDSIVAWYVGLYTAR